MSEIFQQYGSMILKKGSILYHASDQKVFRKVHRKEKPFLFCTFHPSEWFGPKYIHWIRLERDLRLLFMVNDIMQHRIISALPHIMEHPNQNLSKMQLPVQRKMVRILKKRHYHGWFSSIENKATVEVALMNGKDLFSRTGTDKLKRAWRNGNCVNNNKIVCKIWGDRYKITFVERPVKMHLHRRFKKMFYRYKRLEKKSRYLHEYIFQKMLDHAKIKYHKGVVGAE